MSGKNLMIQTSLCSSNSSFFSQILYPGGMRLVLTLGAFLGLLTLAPCVLANDRNSALLAAPSAAAKAEHKRLVSEGVAYYQAKEFRNALNSFQEAYKLDAKVNLIFNIAKCHEALDEIPDAIARYDEFAAKPGADAASRAKAIDSARGLRELEEARKRTAAKVENPTAVPATTTTEAKPPESPDVVKPALPKKPPGGDPYLGLSIGFLAGGVVAGGLGTYFYLKGGQTHSDITDAPNFGVPGAAVGITEARARELADQGTTQKTIGVVLFASAGALLATAGVFALMHKGRPPTTASLPLVLPIQGGALSTWTVRFQ
jgi:tetratricopeptide (TPR) repeat protein